MGALFGAVDYNQPAKLSPKAVVQKMARAHGESLVQQLSHYVDGWTAIAHLPERFSTERPEPLFFYGSRYILFFDGVLLNKSSVAATAHISHEMVDSISTVALLHAAFQSRGIDLFCELDGSFRLAVWDKEEKSLLISTDLSGFQPLYYVREGKRTLWGSEIKFLLKALRQQPEVNRQAISDFVTFGYNFDNHTFFNGIQQVPSGHFLLIQENNVHVLESANELQPRSTVTQLDEAKSLLRNAAMANVKAYNKSNRHLLMLSAGIGSRLVLACSERLGLDQKIISIDSAEKPGCVVDALMSHAASGSLKLEDHQNTKVDRFLRTVWLSDGLLDGSNNRLLASIPFLRAMPNTRLFSGLQPLRNVVRSTELLLWRRRKWTEAQKMWLAGRLFETIYCKGDPFTEVPSAIQRGLASKIDPSERLRALSDQWDLEAKSPAEIMGDSLRKIKHQFFDARKIAVLRHFAAVEMPLYGFSFSDVVASLAGHWQTDDRLVLREVIKDLNSDLYAIAWHKSSRRLGQNPHLQFMQDTWQALQHPELAADVQIEMNPLQMLWKINKLDQGTALFDREFLRTAFWLARKNPGLYGPLLSRLLTVIIWYQFFVEHKDARDFYFEEQDRKQEGRRRTRRIISHVGG